jgi:hypothetical protein
LTVLHVVRKGEPILRRTVNAQANCERFTSAGHEKSNEIRERSSVTESEHKKLRRISAASAIGSAMTTEVRSDGFRLAQAMRQASGRTCCRAVMSASLQAKALPGPEN